MSPSPRKGIDPLVFDYKPNMGNQNHLLKNKEQIQLRRPFSVTLYISKDITSISPSLENPDMN